MDKPTRNLISNATQAARRLLEGEFAQQLEGVYDVLPDGTVAEGGGSHLGPAERLVRDKIAAVLAHKRAGGKGAAEAVDEYLREAAFTCLNRFVALKMLEARDLVRECVSRGDASSGFREFSGLAAGLATLPDKGYRLYVESLFDELSTEIKVLFDRHDPASLLWPRRQALIDLLDILNAPELAAVWGEDETIGWVYQYFNSGDERKKMREESQAPRNSRELAVRNQFFTPRYVVQFLTDNTLGRIWYEMHQGDTALVDRCTYLVRDLEAAAERPKKDPRDIRLLDPAGGSGHFLLYAFDLFLVIYEEAWHDHASPRSKATERTLRENFPDLGSLRRALPALILKHNLHAVDIDPRCMQIAALALWMRAQRAYRDLELPASERVPISRIHVVVAEPMPGDEAMLSSFAASLEPPLLGALFRKMVGEMRLAGELGTLLRVEDGLATELKRAREQFVAREKLLRTGFLPGMEPHYRQGELDLSGIDDAEFFHQAEARIVEALRRFAEVAAGGTGVRRRLFADDAAQGVALIDLLQTRFDIVLMNPPFGLMPKQVYEYLVSNYPSAYYDLAVSFMARGLQVLSKDGLCGAITTRAFMYVSDAQSFRTDFALPLIVLLADLGSGVMDGAAVDASAQVFKEQARGLMLKILDVRQEADKAESLAKAIANERGVQVFPRAVFDAMPGRRLAHDAVAQLATVFSDGLGIEPKVAVARIGASTFDDERFLRARWEVAARDLGSKWLPSSRTAEEFSLYYYPPVLTVKWDRDGREVCARNEQVNGQSAQARQGSTHYGRPGAVFSRRSSPTIAFRAHPAGCAFASNTGVVLPHDAVDMDVLMAVLNSAPVRAAVTALSNRDSYTVGHIKKVKWPTIPAETAAKVGELSRAILNGRHKLFLVEETDPWFSIEALRIREGCFPSFEAYRESVEKVRATLISKSVVIDEEIARLYGVGSLEAVRGAFGVASDDVLQPSRLVSVSWDQWMTRCVSLALGVALGRWSVATGGREGLQSTPPDPYSSIPLMPPSAGQVPVRGSVLVDDPGHPSDLITHLEAAWALLWPGDEGLTAPYVYAALGQGIRDWAKQRLFAAHLEMYRAGKRSAPIYWQLGTLSARYSVWLFVHSCTPDTLFQVLGEYLEPKLAHEERQLAVLAQGLGGGASAAQRKELDEQELFIDELRTLRDEVARIAPLWNLDLDDGILVNFAPLWRLVPQHRAWQKECRACWDRLVAGECDWAHLAMRLWPERVVPKCAEDRSLAIAHGLEEVFWEEDEGGKWLQRHVSRARIEELVRERSIPAVKAALQSMLEAPSTALGRGPRAPQRPGMSRTTARPTGPALEPSEAHHPVQGTAAVDGMLRAVRDAISASPGGASRAEVMASTGISASEWNTAISALLERGEVVRTGGKRGTRYFVKGGLSE